MLLNLLAKYAHKAFELLKTNMLIIMSDIKSCYNKHVCTTTSTENLM